jgi:hypothetical protein
MRLNNKNHMPNFPPKRYHYESRSESISEYERLEIKMWRLGRRVEKFSVAYLLKLNGRWNVIQRYDNAHFEKLGEVIARRSHCHIYGVNKKEYYIYKIRGDPGAILTEAVIEVKKNHLNLLDRYFQN